MLIPPEEKSPRDSVSAKFMAPDVLPPDTSIQEPLETPPNSPTDYINDSVLRGLPNDLTRMIYLASLRDCNSGLYLHPEISHQWGMHAADRAFRICHEHVFRSLLSTRLPEYVLQLREYIRYTRGETIIMLKTWKSLQAYRATVPVGAPEASTEFFFLNLSIALEILSQESSQLHPAY